MNSFSIGEIVQVPYKSGIYIGEVVEDRIDTYLVKIMAVLKHPMQGDLHHPKQVDGVVFHERKALAHYEKVNVPKALVTAYKVEVPEYGISLQTAVSKYKKQLISQDNPYNVQALTSLETVEGHYYLGKYY